MTALVVTNVETNPPANFPHGATQWDPLFKCTNITPISANSYPADLSPYSIVIVDSYAASNPSVAAQLEGDVFAGGNVIITEGNPLFLGMTPSFTSWFGATSYVNTGGVAVSVLSDPFCSGIQLGDTLLDVTGHGHEFAAVSGLHGSAVGFGLWGNGTGPVFSFYNTYGAGKIYYTAFGFGFGFDFTTDKNFQALKAIRDWMVDRECQPWEPTITCVDDIVTDCFTGIPTECDPSAATAQDACGNPLAVTCNQTDNGGTGCANDPLIVTITYEATDESGNSVSCSRTFTVIDDVPPLISCPPDIRVLGFNDLPPCDASQVTLGGECGGEVSVTCSYGISGLGCTDDPIPVSYLFTATDDCGNSASCTWTVTVEKPDCPIPAYLTGADEPIACTCDCHGDPACDGVINVLDVVRVVNVAFRGEAATTDAGCGVSRSDANCDGVANVVDVVGFVNVAFRGGEATLFFCDPCGP